MRTFRSSLLVFSFLILFITACELPQGATSSNNTSAQNTTTKSNIAKVDTSRKLSPQEMRERFKNMNKETVPAEMMVRGTIQNKSMPAMDSIP